MDASLLCICEVESLNKGEKTMSIGNQAHAADTAT